MHSHELIPLLPFMAPQTLARADFSKYDGLAQEGPRTFLLRGEELAALKAAIEAGDGTLADGLAKLRTLADEACDLPIQSVTHKKVAPDGCALSDYHSRAIYFWPNPDTENGLPYVRRDGSVNPDVYNLDECDVRRLETLSAALFHLSLAYYLSSDEKYGRHAATLLRAWFVAPKTRQTPHFKFAQTIPGKPGGRPEGLIEARRYLYIIDAEALIRDCGAWTAKDAAQFRRWFADFFQWMRTSDIGRAAADRKNNLGLWYDVQAAIYALFLDERTLAEAVIRTSVKSRLREQIASNGAPLRELARARPYDYAAFNLLAAMGLARAGEAVGFDAWWAQTADGRSFERALDWTLRVVGGGSSPGNLDHAAEKARLEAQRDEALASLADANALLKAKTAALDNVRALAKEYSGRNGALGERLVEIERKLENARNGEASANERIETLTLALRQAREESARAWAQRRETIERAALMRSALESMRKEIDGLRAELEHATHAEAGAEENRAVEPIDLNRARAEREAASHGMAAPSGIETLRAELARSRASETLLLGERSRLQDNLARAQESAANANKRVEAMLASTSWRMTAPLRDAVIMLRRRPSLAASARIAASALSASPPRIAKALNGAGRRLVQSAPAGSTETISASAGGHARQAPTSAAALALNGAGCLPDYVQSLRSSIDGLERAALRHRSLPARDLLARIATGGAYGYDHLEAMMETNGALAPALSSLPPTALNRRAFASLSRVVGNQAVTPLDELRAISLYDSFIASFGRDKLRAIDHILYVDLLTREGRRGEALAALDQSGLESAEPNEHACLLANILHPGAQVDSNGAKAWLEALNRLFAQATLEPLKLADGGAPLIQRLQCALEERGAVDGPLVSVLMTTFEPDASADMAIGCVLAQSWRNIELIVVDDCSSEAAFAKAKAWEERDPRVRVLRVERNQGTYSGKNRGLEIARGQFVTCHDSDDWSHPRKLEWQASALLGDANLVGNLSCWARATDDMRLRRFAGTGRVIYYNTSSLMFRREPVLARVGRWDNVRTGADSEFYRRIELAFGCTLPLEGKAPLSFGQVRAGALTHKTLGNGFESAARKAYRNSWRHWHQCAQSRGEALYLNGEDRRRFHAPASVLPMRAEDGTQLLFDLVIASDFRRSGANAAACADEIKACASAGMKIAICQMQSFHRDVVGKDMLDPRITDLLDGGLAEQVELEDEARCGLLLLRPPQILQFIVGLRSGVRPERVRIIVSEPPAERDGANRRYDIGACARNAVALFGRQAIWAPVGAPTRDAISAVLRRDQIAASDWPSAIDVEQWRTTRNGAASERPVIGRHLRDDAMKWPDDAEILRAIYPTDGSADVRILGGAANATRLLGQDARNWTIFPFDETAPSDFLKTIDFFVYFPHSRRIETSGRAILEALASGCVAILPPHFRETFGEGAIYCAPREVQSVVRRLARDREEFMRQSAAGMARAAERHDLSMHADHLRAALGVN